MMKVEKAKLIFKKGSKRRQQVDAEVVPVATFVSDRNGTKRDSIENETFNEENTVMKKVVKKESNSGDTNTTDVSGSKRRTSLHKLDRKLESFIAAGILKPSLKYQNSDADMLNDKDYEGMIKASFISGFKSNDKKSLMASNTIKNSLKSEFVTPTGILSKVVMKGKDGKIVPSAVTMTVKFDIPDYVEEEEYKPDEDFRTEIHFS
jgi:retron-type reverse transcriptase